MSSHAKERPAPHGSAYRQLRDLIIRGRLAAGARVVELDVAGKLGVSRTPAREAIKRLHQEGFLNATGSGVRTQLSVSPLTADDLLDVYRIMAALEGTAARHAADLPEDERRALAKSLKSSNAKFEKVSRKRGHDFDELFELHNAFHDELVRAGATPRLRALIDSVRPQVDRYEFVYAPLVGTYHDVTFEEHAAIVRALRDGSPSAAESAVRANWINSAERLQIALSRSGPRGTW